MSFEQIFLLALMAALFAMLLWGRIRHDVVALGALVVAFIAGVVPEDEVFSGFGHPATVIVALVLVVSRGLSNSGAIELIAHWVVDGTRGIRAHVALMAGISAALSAIMNNVAALALLMPIDLQAARKTKRSPALTLMPLSFASILGGMVTLIGTPPNIVIATYREDALGTPYGMFDFTPVGLAVAAVGVAYVALVGWRLIPVERSERNSPRELEDLEGYVAEATVTEGSSAIDRRVGDLRSLAEDNDVVVLGLVRRGKRLPGTAAQEVIRKHDVLVLEGGPEAIEKFMGAAGLRATGADKHGGLAGGTLALMEVVVPAGSRIEGRSALDVRLLYRQEVTLLGVSRSGQRFRERVRKLPIRAGDILLLMGPEERLPDVVAWLGALPLAERGLHVTQREKALPAVALFALAILVGSLGWVYLPVALAGVVVAYAVLRIVPLSQLFESVHWPVIVLLGSLIPLGAALEESGGTALIAQSIVGWTEGMSAAFVLALLMVVTMTLSDVLNNVATALIAAPIGVDIAQRLGTSPDPFLMAVAVAASCAFLTPIGHKNNTIIMGPGGYRFGDYWRMGLPLELLVILVGTPVILLVWPL
ncbi:MAG: SLC13 family permease [Acidobacteriota bacterium]|nr:SLC13 family permease [Acidobacteriota bacterium]